MILKVLPLPARYWPARHVGNRPIVDGGWFGSSPSHRVFGWRDSALLPETVNHQCRRIAARTFLAMSLTDHRVSIGARPHRHAQRAFLRKCFWVSLTNRGVTSWTTFLTRSFARSSKTRAILVASVARGRRWLDELISNEEASTRTIAKREGCSVRKVNMTISLALLAPNLVKAAIEGRLPRGIGVTRLTDLPAEWSRQRHLLGLTEV